MKTTKQVLYGISAMLILLAGLFFLISRAVLLGGFSQVEKERVSHNMMLSASALDDDITALDTTTHDWAQWDETYNYVLKKDPAYESRNFKDMSFVPIGISVMAVLDRNGNFVYRKLVDLKQKSEVKLPREAWDNFRAGIVPLMFKKPNGFKGLTTFNGQTMAVAVRPILTTDGKGPPQGMFLMGRFLDASAVMQLSEAMHFPLSARRVAEGCADDKTPCERPALSLARPYASRPVDSKTIAGFALIADIYGKPLLVLASKQDRVIYATARRSLRVLTVASLIGGVVFILASLVIMNLRVLRPVAKLIQDIIEIGDRSNESARLPRAASVELEALRSSINALLDAREKSTEALRRSEARFRAVIEDQTEMICRLSPDGAFNFTNAAFTAFLNRIMAGSRTDKWVPAVDDPEIISAMSHMASVTIDNPVVDYIAEFRASDGDKLWMEWTCRGLFNEDATVSEYQLVGRNITARKKAEQALLRTQSYAAIATMYMGLSHEIKNPLAAIKAHAETLMENEEIQDIRDEKVRYSLDVITNHAERIDLLINSMASMGRDSAFNPVAVDVGRQLRTLLDIFRPNFEKHGITCEINAPENFILEVDETRFNQIISNLALNAIAAMPDGGRLDVSAGPGGGETAEIIISDSGRGICEPNLLKIFEPFFTTSPRGMGMGLFLCRRYMEDHEGEISIESSEGKGTKVTLKFPNVKARKAN